MKKLFFTSIFIIIFASFSFAQVDLEINDGMTVETTGSLSIELSGDLIENGTGYLKGEVTSGDRGSGALSTFAGLTLTTGGVDQITRKTGNAITPGPPLTSLRYYEILNTSSSFSTDVSSTFVSSGANDERNGVNDLFLYVNSGSSWQGFSDYASTPSLITGKNLLVNNSPFNVVISEGVGIGATIFLEGPYQGSPTPMTDVLTIPSTSPYTEAPRTTSVPPNAIDWVCVELRSGTTAGSSLGFRSAFVDANGNLINDNGTPGIGFPTHPATGRLVIKHRNHLSVMSNTDLTYNWLSQ